MKPEDIAPADVELFKKLHEAAEGKIASVTLAPELKNIEPIIDFCREHKILIQAGHTNATYEEFVTGIRQGIRHATHLFNALYATCPRCRGSRVDVARGFVRNYCRRSTCTSRHCEFFKNG